MANVTKYGDITPRQAAYSVKEMLTRGMPYLCIEKFGQTFPIPKNNTTTAKFRRYYLSGSTGGAVGSSSAAYGVPLATVALQEGVTPQGSKLLSTDVTVTLAQYGDYIVWTDVIGETHEDPVLQQASEILGEQAAMTVEALRYNVLKAGTNVFYNNGSARTDVNTAITLANQRKVTTALLRQNARRITRVVKSTPDYRTEPVEAAFIGLIHPDMETDVRSLSGFIPTKQYGTVTPYENEIGSVEQVRYLTSTLFTPFADGGGAKGAMRSTTGTSADVYPVLYLAQDAFGIVPLKGANSLTPMVVNPKPAAGDPLGQRGTVGWKTWQATTILNDAWMARLECGATA